MPCVIYNPSRAFNNLREAGAGRRSRKASNVTAAPRTDEGISPLVHDLFLGALACALMFGVAFGSASGFSRVTASVEIGARFVVSAGGAGLGTMAKAGHPKGMDRLL